MSGSTEFTDRADDLNQGLAASGEGKEFFARGKGGMAGAVSGSA